MSEKIFDEIRKRVRNEPFAGKMGLSLEEIGDGYSMVKMELTPDMENFFGDAHGGAVFSLIYEALEIASNSHGKIAVPLNVNITYHEPPSPGDVLTAEASEENLTIRTGSYYISVRNQAGKLIASCQALACRKKELLPFLGEWTEY